ncbi:ABC transporter permease [Microbacterium album]|uniref:ABC transmembrane type-1 domain-containing protein n=1 Tax=Microbacterium album TaxID=2053191 RepID=A0A917II57_9MICO|nr:ABC transporter permease subunit [Microbacterium album]GGH48436.1 hypothetical protein GCM10010921_25900 [Microbacterium album]
MSLLERPRTAGEERRAASRPRPDREKRKLPGWGQQLLFLLAVLLIWGGLRLLDVISAQALPGPWAVAASFVEAVQTPAYWVAILETFRSAAIGLGIALLIGIPLGLIIGMYAVVEKSTRIVIEIGRSFPVVTILPVLLLILGATLSMKALVVFIACVFPIIIQAQYGAQSVSEAVNETVRSYRIPRLLRFAKVSLPAAMPSIMTGLRLATTLAVLVAVGIEVLTPVPGIGHEIASSQIDANASRAWVYILTAATIGYCINRLSIFAESKLLAWRPPSNLDE